MGYDFFSSFLRAFLRRQEQEVGYVIPKRTERIKGVNEKLNGAWWVGQEKRRFQRPAITSSQPYITCQLQSKALNFNQIGLSEEHFNCSSPDLEAPHRLPSLGQLTFPTIKLLCFSYFFLKSFSRLVNLNLYQWIVIKDSLSSLGFDWSKEVSWVLPVVR